MYLEEVVSATQYSAQDFHIQLYGTVPISTYGHGICQVSSSRVGDDQRILLCCIFSKKKVWAFFGHLK